MPVSTRPIVGHGIPWKKGQIKGYLTFDSFDDKLESSPQFLNYFKFI